jgi:hypothetical protein
MLRTATDHAAHFLMDAVIGIIGLAGLAGCVLAWRLAQGPIDITALVQREIPRLTQSGATLTVGSAALAWEGFRAADSPLDIRWRDVMVTTGPTGTPISLPQGSVTLSTSRLLLGQIVPRSVEIDGATIDLRRDASGTLRLDLEKAPPPATTPSPPGSEGGVPAVLRELTRPANHPGALPFLAQLRTVRIRNASITVTGPTGLLWQAQSATVDLQRQDSGGITGQAGVTLDFRGGKTTLALQAELSGAGTHVVATATPVSPATMAASMPALRPFLLPVAGFAMPIGAKVDATLDPHLGLTTATAALHGDAGTLQVGLAQVAVQSADLVLEGSADHVVLRSLRLALQARPAAHGPAPVVTGSGAMSLDGGRMRANVTVDIDQAQFADLADYWPADTGGGARPWITENIPTGLAEKAHVTASLEGPADFSNVKVTGLSGSLSASDLTVHWLRPIPPIDHGQARLVLDGPDALHIDILSARQGPLRITGGVMRITGLQGKDQFGDIDTQISGGLPDIITLLNSPRLHLLSRQPVQLQNPAGDARVKLRVKLPLDERVTMDDIDVNATAKLTGVHLGGIAAGRDLDRGTLDLAVTSNDLSVTGDADFASIPANLTVKMDFRAGPPSQRMLHVTADGRATAQQLMSAGLWGGIITGGTTGVAVDYSSLRDGTAVAAMSADLNGAVIATPLGWNKPAGQAASASARIKLLHDSLVGIDQIKASGPGLLIASHADLMGGQPRLLHLDTVKIGRTDVHGTITFPRRAADKTAIVLRGPTLDLSSYFVQRDTSGDTDDDDTPGKPWSLDIAFGQAILAKDETLAPVAVRAESNGSHISRGDVTAGPGGQVRGSIIPMAGGRKLSVHASDAGAVLLAAGVANNIRGGTLKVDGSYADTKPHSPLSGTATLAQFRLTNAPAMGKLLTAMTLYGAVNLLSGPGLGFQQASVPFRWQQRVLHMDNARAFSASLGITAQGDIDLRAHRVNVQGTVVPAYFFNQLPGKIPLIGRLFSPEKGGGLFAANYSVTGKLADPHVSVNALSALTPGFLRGVFGLF